MLFDGLVVWGCLGLDSRETILLETERREKKKKEETSL